jgi:hypothetical protein
MVCKCHTVAFCPEICVKMSIFKVDIQSDHLETKCSWVKVSQGKNVTVDISSGSKCHSGRNVVGRNVKASLSHKSLLLTWDPSSLRGAILVHPGPRLLVNWPPPPHSLPVPISRPPRVSPKLTMRPSKTTSRLRLHLVRNKYNSTSVLFDVFFTKLVMCVFSP